MRIRNVKDKEEILSSCCYLIKEPKKYKGKFRNLFNNDNPIYIEIGMGKGKFIYENAKKYKDINFIGIEKYDSVIAQAIKKIDEKLDNLYLIRMNALDINDIFDNEIDRIYLNFSDPWPKVRHHFRRLTSPIFLEKYDKIFKGTKEIYLRTDNSSLFIYSLETLSNHDYYLNEISFNLHNEDIKDLITTEYEDKFSKKNMPIYSLKATSEKCLK